MTDDAVAVRGLSTDAAQFARLFAAGHPLVYVPTTEEDHALGVLVQAAVDRGADLWTWSATRGLRDGLVANSAAVVDTDNPAAALYYLSTERAKEGVFVFFDLCGHLKEPRVSRALRDAVARVSTSNSHLVLVEGATSDDLPPAVAACATRVDLSLPDDAELEQIVRHVVRACHGKVPVTVSVGRAQFDAVVRNLRGLTRRQARQVVTDVVTADRRFDADDVANVLAGKRRLLGTGGALESVEAPTSLDAIGGLRTFKAWLAQRSAALTRDAAAFGLPPPRGVLMLGVQGAGKSLSAKAVATAWDKPLVRLDVGGLYDRYIGESERRLREALRQAAAISPCVLWIDEIEKAFASAGSGGGHSSDGGLSRRMFGSLLTWMQERTAPVFLFATANDIDALPPELLRKGRFDEIFFVDLPADDVRRQIFDIHLRRRGREPARFDLSALAAAAAGFSGAEIEQAVVAALFDAYAADRAELTTAHVLAAVRRSPPLSVTRAEQIAALRAWAQGRCVPAD